MYVVGLIAEYNPFHKGHAFQIQEIRRRLGEKVALVVALSSHFTQRGLPAMMSLSKRAQSAIEGGADLVFLLPQYFSCAEASCFATGGVRLLASTGIVQTIASGSEVPDLQAISQCAQNLLAFHQSGAQPSGSSLRDGLSPFQAEQKRMEEFGFPESLLPFLQKPNSRLSVLYQCAALQLPSGWRKPTFFVTPRLGNSENSDDFSTSSQASAQAIRQQFTLAAQGTPLFESHQLSPSLLEGLSLQIPSNSLSLLLQESNEKGLLLESAFNPFILYELIRGISSDISYRYLDKNLIDYLRSTFRSTEAESELGASTLPADWFQRNATKNYPAGRLRRALLSLFLGIMQDMQEVISDTPGFLYPLAFNHTGRYLLKRMNEKSLIPLISDSSQAQSLASQSNSLRMQIDLERRSASFRSLLCGTSYPAFPPPLYCRWIKR